MLETFDALGKLLGGAFFIYLCGWIVRLAVRAELKRVGIVPRKSEITEEVDLDSRSITTYPCPNCGCGSRR